MTRLIIVAAGTGSRLMPLTKNIPKPLLHIDEKDTILEAALKEIIKSKVIDEVIYIVGYLAEQIESKVKNIGGIKIKTIYTPYYNVAGNFHSLWFARNEMHGDDIMITNADNIIDASVYKRLDKEEGITLCICENDNLKEDDAKVFIDGDEVVNVSKEIKVTDGIMESVSLLKVSKNKVDKFRSILDKLIREEDNFDETWLIIFFRLFKEGIHVKPMKIQKRYWFEVDFHSDLLEVIREKHKKFP